MLVAVSHFRVPKHPAKCFSVDPVQLSPQSPPPSTLRQIKLEWQDSLRVDFMELRQWAGCSHSVISWPFIRFSQPPFPWKNTGRSWWSVEMRKSWITRRRKRAGNIQLNHLRDKVQESNFGSFWENWDRSETFYCPVKYKCNTNCLVCG